MSSPVPSTSPIQGSTKGSRKGRYNRADKVQTKNSKQGFWVTQKRTISNFSCIS